MTKKIFLKKALLVLFAFMLAFTFCITPIQAIAPVLAVGLVALGAIAISACAGVIVHEGIEGANNIDWGTWWPSHSDAFKIVDGVVVSETSLLGDISFAEEIMFGVLKVFFNKPELSTVEYVYTDGKVIFPDDAEYKKVLELGVMSFYSHCYEVGITNASGVPLAYTGRDVLGNYTTKELPNTTLPVNIDVATMAESEITVGGKVFSTFSFSSPMNLSLFFGTNQGGSSILVPSFEYNGDLYIYRPLNFVTYATSSTTYGFSLVNNGASWNIKNNCYNKTKKLGYCFASYDCLANAFKTTIEISFKSFFSDTNSVFNFLLDSEFSEHPYILTNGVKNESLYFSDNYLNCRDNTVYNASDLSLDYYDILNKTKFIYFPSSNDTKEYSGVFDAWIFNNLKGYTLTGTKELSTVAIPRTKNEEVIDEAKKSGLVSALPRVSITEDGKTTTVDDVDIKDLAKTLEIPQTGTETETETGSETENDNEKPKLDLDLPLVTDKFPFSLPFDLYNAFTILSAEPKTPVFVIPLSNISEGDYKIGNSWYSSDGRKKSFGFDYSITIDFEKYHVISIISRSMFYIIFLIGLIMATNKLIGRGG